MSRNKAAEQAAVILAPSFTDVFGYIYLIKYKYKYQTNYIKSTEEQGKGVQFSHPCAYFYRCFEAKYLVTVCCSTYGRRWHVSLIILIIHQS